LGPWLGRGEKFGLFEGQKRHFLMHFLNIEHMRTCSKHPSN
jgi:hypothetical protein